MREPSSGRRRRLPAKASTLVLAVGSCLCVGQLAASAAERPAASSPVPAATTTKPAAVASVAIALRAAGTAALAPAPTFGAASGVRAQPAGVRPARKPVTQSSHDRAIAGRLLDEASRHSGRPYVFGASGPSAFDCSGFTRYVFRKVAGLELPHKANSQQRFGRHVPRSEVRPGDLIFFRSGSYAYHVAIYAGGGYMYDAPRPGRTVGKHKIWSSDYVVRRLVG